MQHAKLGLKKKTGCRVIAVIGSDSIPRRSRSIHCHVSRRVRRSPYPTGYCITVFDLRVYPSWLYLTITPIYSNRINQSFSFSPAKLKGLNCYKMSHRQHAPNQMTKLYTDIAAPSVKLAVRFHPVQPKRVQESREALWHRGVASPGPVSGRTFAHQVDKEYPPP
jgi:hypothetical protein